jgi:hypothetical protein
VRGQGSQFQIRVLGALYYATRTIDHNFSCGYQKGPNDERNGTYSSNETKDESAVISRHVDSHHCGLSIVKVTITICVISLYLAKYFARRFDYSES